MGNGLYGRQTDVGRHTHIYRTLDRPRSAPHLRRDGLQLPLPCLLNRSFHTGRLVSYPCNLLPAASGPGSHASHTAVTGMVKYFRFSRGKAVALATLGLPVGRALLPVAAVASIAAIGWRETYVICAIFALVLILPTVIWLLSGVGEEEDPIENSPNLENTSLAIPSAPVNYSLGYVLRDPGFYFLLPAILAPSFFDTALSFHLLSVASLKAWSAEWVTAGYAIYALTSIAASMWVGALHLSQHRFFPRLHGTRWAWVFLALYVGIKAPHTGALIRSLWRSVHIGRLCFGTP